MNKSIYIVGLVVSICLAGSLPSSAMAKKSGLFHGKQVPPPNQRIYIQNQGDLTVATAVPSAEESRVIFGANLYRKNIQPVWVQVENNSDKALFLTPMSLDQAYYFPRESAHRSQEDSSSSQHYQHYQQFESKALVELRVPPHSIQSSYIFTQVDEGTKSFNVDIIGDGVGHRMTFFIPVPGLKLDHYDVDITGMYAESQLQGVNLAQLFEELEAMPCCVVDKQGVDMGDPLNLVFIGNIDAMYYAFLRAGWDETETIHSGSLLKTAGSALLGSSYRYSPVSALYLFGRSQDIALQRSRESIHERNHLRLWLTTLRFEGKPVWMGQISRDIGVHFTWRTITTHKIDPDVDETREFLMEDLAYAAAVEKISYVGGVGAAPYEKPRRNLTGDPYFTDGKRVVIWISNQPVAIDNIEIIDSASN